MKRLKFFLFALLVYGNAYAYDFEAGGIYYNIIAYGLSHSLEVTYCPYGYYSGEITIPEEVVYDGALYTVRGIGETAFLSCNSLISVTMPNSISSIGNSAFSGSGLTSVVIPEGVTKIGDYAFSGCRRLVSVAMPESLTEIGGHAFQYCTDLASVTIPKSVTSIGVSAFGGCEGLEAVHISDLSAWCRCDIDFQEGVHFYYEGNPLFYAHNLYLNDELITDLVIPDGVTRIEDMAFIGATCLKSVTISESVASIGEYAFKDCENLSAVHISDLSAWCSIDFSYGGMYSNPLHIAHDLYLDNELITDLVVPDNVAKIGDYAFYGGSFKSVVMPETVASIGCCAFTGCSNLVSITIPENVTIIGDAAFSSCSSLVSVNIPESVVEIGESAFFYCSSLASLTIPEGVSTIGDYTFWHCSSLFSVLIPESVTSIGTGAFLGCGSLVSVTVPESVATVGTLAFAECSSLTSVIIPESVATIGDFAFQQCDNLVSVTIGSGVTDIGYGVFEYCGNLAEVNSLAVTPPSIYNNTFELNHYSNSTLNVTVGSLSAYKSAEYWNNFLRVSEKDFAGVERMDGNAVSVTANGGYICVAGVGGDATIEVYNLSGRLVYSGMDSVIPVAGNGLYIVKVSGSTFKISM